MSADKYPCLLYGKESPSVLIGSFSVGILPYGPSKPCIFLFKSRQVYLQLKLLKENMLNTLFLRMEKDDDKLANSKTNERIQ